MFTRAFTARVPLMRSFSQLFGCLIAPRARMPAEPLARRSEPAPREPARPRSDTSLAALWRWDLVNGTMDWNPAADRLLDLDEGQYPSLAHLISLVPAGERAAFAAWLARLARGKAERAFEFRIAAAGDMRRIRASAVPHRDEDGETVVVTGNFVALSAAALKQAA